jgi:hypothetical protein
LGGVYQLSAQTLYSSLSGKVNYIDPPVAGARYYMTFKTTQLGNYRNAANGATYVQDPFGFAYGYYTGDPTQPLVNPPSNGGGFFDLWSTGGNIGTANSVPNSAAWISNWK